MSFVSRSLHAPLKGKLHSKIISSDMKDFFRRIWWWRSEVEIRTGRRSNRRWKTGTCEYLWRHGATVVPPRNHARVTRLAPVTHAGRAASPPEIFRLFDRLPVRISTSDLHHWNLREKIFHIGAYDFGVQFSFKVARNEVENTSFAQRSAHRDSRIWRPELIEQAVERKRRARARTATEVRIGLPRPTDFATVQYLVQLSRIMFGFSESAEIGLSF